MKPVIFILLSIVVLMGCGKGNDNTPTPPPGKATLLLPAQNEVCTQGVVVSATQSAVTLKWATANDADNYEVIIKNIEDGTNTSKTTSNTQIDLTLKRNTPYSWSVTSKSASSTVTTKSDVWKFYNSGPAIVNYAPFPAEIVAPDMNQIVTVTNDKVTLSWAGSDVDNDIVDYDIYWGELATPALLQHNMAESMTDVAAVAGKTYYWKVITRDSKGNMSDSGIYKFTAE